MQNAATMRERMFTMRLSEEESLRLDRVAAHYGVNAANLVRMLLKREDDAIGTTWAKDVSARLTDQQRGVMALFAKDVTALKSVTDVTRKLGGTGREAQALFLSLRNLDLLVVDEGLHRLTSAGLALVQTIWPPKLRP